MKHTNEDIQRLDWDSDFFKMEIGQINVSSLEQWMKYFTSNLLNRFEIIYVMSNSVINHPSLKQVDRKITFKKTTNYHQTIDKNIEEFNLDIHSFNELLELVFLSGSLSRFKLDPAFGEVKFKALYKKWILKAIESKTKIVLVYIISNKITGFVSFCAINNTIELIAVDPNYQNLKIGKKLLVAVELYLSQEKILKVSTQEKNKAACSFYTKFGFELMEKKYIYHYAKNPI
jgi:dTDP-4-amino-4,6-dideoxy-D-galactose acyltransferase